ncbi:hypothetical protein [Allorhizocola rhizosphaerae]|uniref:hypothetical protein n=1 Tax=Allorhizocola rhizosphaerae TaxID=1872709 RepID=UPI000E3E0D26|nr:hypothetical protein [Allorhizocola rhizosphaerae]
MATSTVSALTGPWLARVARPSGTVEIGLRFCPDGSVFIVAGGHGAGAWTRRRTGFTYHIREPMLDDQGGFAGHVIIRQAGTVDGDAFTSRGESSVYDTHGSLLRTVAIRITAVRRDA